MRQVEFDRTSLKAQEIADRNGLNRVIIPVMQMVFNRPNRHSATKKTGLREAMMRKYGKELGFAIRSVHTGNDVDGETGAIRRPITMANSYALPYDPSDLNRSSAGKNLYTRKNFMTVSPV